MGTNKLELLENLEFGNRCLITATQRILDRLDVENTTYAKIEYFGRKEHRVAKEAGFFQDGFGNTCISRSAACGRNSAGRL